MIKTPEDMIANALCSDSLKDTLDKFILRTDAGGLAHALNLALYIYGLGRIDKNYWANILTRLHQVIIVAHNIPWTDEELVIAALSGAGYNVLEEDKEKLANGLQKSAKRQQNKRD
jgi:hypothetical protein